MQCQGRAFFLSAVLAAVSLGAGFELASREAARVTASAVVSIDVDGDGVDELYCLEGGQHVIRDLNGSARWRSEESLPPVAASPVLLVADVAAGRTPEVVVAADRPDTAVVFWFDLQTRSLRRCVVDSGKWSVMAMAAADVNGDGRFELLVALRAGRGFGQDLVCAFDCRSGSRLWSAGVGPGVTRLLVDDVDGDGSADVLVGLGTRSRFGGPKRVMSPDSVVSIDSAPRVVCLGSDGRERWSYQPRAPVSESREVAFGVAHTEREGLAVPVVLDRCGAPEGGQDVLRVLNGADGRVITEAWQPGRARLVGLVVEDLDRDDMPEVVTVDSRGGMELRDISLKSLATRLLDDIVDSVGVMAMPGVRGRLLFAVQESAVTRTDIEPRKHERHETDGCRGQCSVSSDFVSSWPSISDLGAVTFLDSRLRVVGRFESRSRVSSVVPVAAGRAGAALLVGEPAADSSGLKTFRVVKLSLVLRPFPWLPVLAVLVVILAAGVAVVVYTNALHAAALRGLSRRLVESAGIAVLDRKGRLAPRDGRARLLLADYANGNRLDISTLLARPEFSPLRGALEIVRSGAMRTARCEVMLLVDRLPRAYRVTVSASLFGACLLAFEDLSAVEYVRHIREWGPVAQRMAHGIKNPLTAMSLTLQRMERDCPPGTREQVASLMDDVDRLRRMADGFMRFVRLERPRLACEDLNAVIRACVDRPGSVRPEGIVVEFALSDKLPLVSLDRAQFCMVVDNLLGNAVTAMGGRGTLRVTTELLEPRRPTERRRAVIKFQDTGRGIPERYVERLFEPYFSLSPGGTGLGLCIAKRIVEDHNGSIVVESFEGKGTTIIITLPVEVR